MQSGRIHAIGAALLACGFLLTTAPVSAQSPQCNAECLEGLVDQYLDAVLEFDQMALPPKLSPLPWAETVRSTENDVAMMIGEGLWGTVDAVEPGLMLTDARSGNALWLGAIEEHGASAYLALRIGADAGRIAEVEAIVGREGTPGPYASSQGYRVDSSFAERLPARERTSRERMVALVEGWYNTMQLNDGAILTDIADDCVRLSNGVALSHRDDVAAEGCRQQFEIGYYKPVDRVRARRFPVIDEERGVVVAAAFLDHAARYVEYETLDGATRSIDVEYPNTHSVIELFRIRDGQIERVEGVSVFQLYMMPTIW